MDLRSAKKQQTSPIAETIVVTPRSKTTENDDDIDIDASFVEITSVCNGIIDDLEKTLGCDAIHKDISDGDFNEDKAVCGKCGKGFYSRSCKCIWCDKCNKWYHIACVGVSKREFEYFDQSDSSDTWTCQSCGKGQTLSQSIKGLRQAI